MIIRTIALVVFLAHVISSVSLTKRSENLQPPPPPSNTTRANRLHWISSSDPEHVFINVDGQSNWEEFQNGEFVEAYRQTSPPNPANIQTTLTSIYDLRRSDGVFFRVSNRGLFWGNSANSITNKLENGRMVSQDDGLGRRSNSDDCDDQRSDSEDQPISPPSSLTPATRDVVLRWTSSTNPAHYFIELGNNNWQEFLNDQFVTDYTETPPRVGAGEAAIVTLRRSDRIIFVQLSRRGFFWGRTATNINNKAENGRFTEEDDGLGTRNNDCDDCDDQPIPPPSSLTPATRVPRMHWVSSSVPGHFFINFNGGTGWQESVNDQIVNTFTEPIPPVGTGVNAIRTLRRSDGLFFQLSNRGLFWGRRREQIDNKLENGRLQVLDDGVIG